MKNITLGFIRLEICVERNNLLYDVTQEVEVQGASNLAHFYIYQAFNREKKSCLYNHGNQRLPCIASSSRSLPFFASRALVILASVSLDNANLLIFIYDRTNKIYGNATPSVNCSGNDGELVFGSVSTQLG